MEFVVSRGILLMHVLHFKRGILMLSILIKVKGGITDILTPTIKDGEATLTLGMALKPTHLVLTKYFVNLLIKIGPTSY